MYESAAIVKLMRILSMYSSSREGLSSPSLRSRFVGGMYSPSSQHEHVRQGASQSMNESLGLMRAPRWPLAGRNRLSVGLLLCQYPIRCFCQMASYRYHSLGMPFPSLDALVQPNHMLLRPLFLLKNYAVGRLYEGSLEIAVHIRTNPPTEGFSSRRTHSRYCACVAGKMRCIGEPLHRSDLQEDRKSV